MLFRSESDGPLTDPKQTMGAPQSAACAACLSYPQFEQLARAEARTGRNAVFADQVGPHLGVADRAGPEGSPMRCRVAHCSRRPKPARTLPVAAAASAAPAAAERARFSRLRCWRTNRIGVLQVRGGRRAHEAARGARLQPRRQSARRAQPAPWAARRPLPIARPPRAFVRVVQAGGRVAGEPGFLPAAHGHPAGVGALVAALQVPVRPSAPAPLCVARTAPFFSAPTPLTPPRYPRTGAQCPSAPRPSYHTTISRARAVSRCIGPTASARANAARGIARLREGARAHVHSSDFLCVPAPACARAQAPIVRAPNRPPACLFVCSLHYGDMERRTLLPRMDTSADRTCAHDVTAPARPSSACSPAPFSRQTHLLSRCDALRFGCAHPPGAGRRVADDAADRRLPLHHAAAPAGAHRRRKASRRTCMAPHCAAPHTRNAGRTCVRRRLSELR